MKKSIHVLKLIRYEFYLLPLSKHLSSSLQKIYFRYGKFVSHKQSYALFFNCSKRLISFYNNNCDCWLIDRDHSSLLMKNENISKEDFRYNNNFGLHYFIFHTLYSLLSAQYFLPSTCVSSKFDKFLISFMHYRHYEYI